MAPALLLALGAHLARAGAFSPFAGVEELKPQRLQDFCDEPDGADEDRPGLRWCQHSVRKRLEDDGDVELNWRMRVDPDTILSLDTEAEHGVRVVRCSVRELELELPASHAKHAEVGKYVVGSRFVHGCGHMPENHLYRRVAAVQRQGETSFRLSTEDLPDFAHTVPSLSFGFSYMPIEARETEVSHPEMRTDYGENRELLESRGRRLFSPLAFAKKMAKMKGVSTDTGGFRASGSSGGTVNTKNGMLNLKPKQVSNFGWNWNFAMNTTQEPNYNVTIPGAKGVVKIRKPYVRVHSGIFLNFTSEFGGITMAPRVNWQFGMNGHGYVQGRVLAILNTTHSADVDPIQKFDLPMLQRLHTAQWFQKVEFATGHMPISFEPGFKFNAKMYHKGDFHGAVAFGGHTHGNFTPLLSFDSQKGFDVRWNGTLKDVEFFPPLWMIFTKRFEVGIMLVPMLLMRGDFAGLEKATFALEFRPYLNVTVTREGDNSTDEPGDEMRMLTVYPYRVMGIKEVQYQRKYKVRIEALGQEIETSPQMNWGHVLFRDHVSKFSLGETPQRSVIEEAITVSLIEVDDGATVPTERVIGSGQVQCTSLLNGVCHPSPPIAHIMQGTVEVAAVELAVIWQNSPEPWFVSKIRGVGVSFPRVVLRQDALSTAFASEGSPVAQALTMHLIHDGLTYTVPIQGDIHETGAALHGDTVVEFGPGFVETWLPCSLAAGGKCESPRLELYYGRQQVAVANLPQIEWTSQTAMQGTKDGFMASSDVMSVPCSVVLYAPGSTTSTVAVVTMNAEVVSPGASSFVLEPTSATKVPMMSTMRVAWTMSSVDKSQSYYFTLQPMKVVSVVPTQMSNYVTYRKVGSEVLMDISNHSQAFTTRCTTKQIRGMSADEAPCSFDHNLPINAGFAIGDQAVVRISWSRDGKHHEMYSPPFVIVAAGASRRLRTTEMLETPAHARQLSLQKFKNKWNNVASSHAESCARKDLKFHLGAGMLFRGRVDNVGVPKGFPMLGGLDEEPTLTTGFRKIAGIKPGTDAKDLMPATLCKGGLCQGALPGCTDSEPKKQEFPILRFNLSRPYHYDQRKKKGKFGGLMKTALAYAFSTLPEMVEIAIKALNSTHNETVMPPTTTKSLPVYPSLGPGSAAGIHYETHSTAAPTPWAQQPSVPVEPAAPAADPEAGNAFKRWWSGAATRRLSAALPQEPAANQVLVSFRGGLPYNVDRELVERMLANGYFMELEDDAPKELGPLHFTSLVAIHKGEAEVLAPPDAAALPAPGSSLGWPLLMAGGAAASLAVLLFAKGSRSVKTAWAHCPAASPSSQDLVQGLE